MASLATAQAVLWRLHGDGQRWRGIPGACPTIRLRSALRRSPITSDGHAGRRMRLSTVTVDLSCSAPSLFSQLATEVVSGLWRRIYRSLIGARHGVLDPQVTALTGNASAAISRDMRDVCCAPEQGRRLTMRSTRQRQKAMAKRGRKGGQRAPLADTEQGMESSARDSESDRAAPQVGAHELARWVVRTGANGPGGLNLAQARQTLFLFFLFFLLYFLFICKFQICIQMLL
jgi:hypothetical protein